MPVKKNRNSRTTVFKAVAVIDVCAMFSVPHLIAHI